MGRILKWASELRLYGLRFESRTIIKGQVLVDLIADFTPEATEQCHLLERWILNVDRASNIIEADIEVVLTTPKGSIIEQSFCKTPIIKILI